MDARIDLRAAPSLARRFARRGPDVVFPAVMLRAEPKQEKHRWQDRDLGVVLAPKRPRRRRDPAGRLIDCGTAVGSGGEVAGLEYELMQTCGGVC